MDLQIYNHKTDNDVHRIRHYVYVVHFSIHKLNFQHRDGDKYAIVEEWKHAKRQLTR